MTFKYFMLKCGQFQLILWPLFFLFMVNLNNEVSPGHSTFSMIYISVALVSLVNVGLAIHYPIQMVIPEKWQEVTSVPILIIVFAVLIHIAVFVCYPLFSGNPSDAEITRPRYAYALVTINKAAYIFMIVAWIALHVLSRYNVRKAREEEEIRHQKELESKRMEYQFLSSQVNPHFLNNMINQLIQECEEQLPETADRIGILGELTRFYLEIAGQPSITISREIEALENYLSLQTSRFPDCQIDFIGKEHVGGERIIPGALIIILENVFKHGLFRGPANPIKIRLESSYNSLLFTCCNRIDKLSGPKESTGIGLANIRKRLDIQFPEKYRFETSETTDGSFYVILEIQQV
ncbi:MAG: sensor histidine kinase [Sphingobacterium sp.]